MKIEQVINVNKIQLYSISCVPSIILFDTITICHTANSPQRNLEFGLKHIQ